jgi:hypothetical protein
VVSKLSSTLAFPVIFSSSKYHWLKIRRKRIIVQ